MRNYTCLTTDVVDVSNGYTIDFGLARIFRYKEHVNSSDGIVITGVIAKTSHVIVIMPKGNIVFPCKAGVEFAIAIPQDGTSVLIQIHDPYEHDAPAAYIKLTMTVAFVQLSIETGCVFNGLDGESDSPLPFYIPAIHQYS